MTAKFFRWSAAFFGLVLFFSLGAGISHAASQPARYAQDKDKDKDKGEKKEKVNKAEEAAYKAFFAAQASDPATQIQLGEDFITKYPTSRYLPGVYGTLTTAYFSTGAMDKMFAAGAKALELNPDNVDVLALLAMAIPRRVKSTTPDGAQQLQKAEMYAHHAIELMPTLVKPPTVDDASFEKAKNDKLSLAHSGLGLMDLNNKKFEDARNELTQAVQLASNPDSVDYYLLGNADVQANYYNDAAAAYDKCSTSGPLATQCKAREESAKHDASTKLGR